MGVQRNIHPVGKETKWSFYSLASLAAVVLLHGIHWLALPVLAGSAAEMASHHHQHQHSAAGSGGVWPAVLTAGLWIANAGGVYFAVRQLAAAGREWRRRSLRTYLFSAVSIGVLLVAVYSFLALR
jgi:hypothetical protein